MQHYLSWDWFQSNCNHIDQLLRLSAWPLRFTMIGTNKFKMANIWKNPFYAVSIDFCCTTKKIKESPDTFCFCCLLNQLIIFVLPKINFSFTDVSYTWVFVLLATVNVEQCWLIFCLILIHLSHQRSALHIVLWYSCFSHYTQIVQRDVFPLEIWAILLKSGQV